MDRCTFALIAILAAFGLLHAGQPGKPNIILIIADDLGWKDVGWHASELKTPT